MLNDFYLDRCLKVETELTQHLLRVGRGAREPAGATSATALLGQEVGPGAPPSARGADAPPSTPPSCSPARWHTSCGAYAAPQPLKAP